LYAYYLNFKDQYGLMNWKIEGFDRVSSDNGSYAATDGDLDVALALCLAAKQWESSSRYNYADEAGKILDIIYNKELETKNNLKIFAPGDNPYWRPYTNPCYFTIASVGVFKQAQNEYSFTPQKDWAKVYTDCHTFLAKAQKNGLWPDWCTWDGSLGTGNSSTADNYGWDACRTPWRIAWDYVWYGNEESKEMMGKTIEFMKAISILSSPSTSQDYKNLGATSYSGVQAGGNYGTNNSAFMGGFACALMTDDSQQTNINTYYTSLQGRSESGYYSPTLQVLYMLTLSGNAANFFDCGGSGVVTPPVVSAATTDGKSITLTCSKKMASSTNYSGFTVYLNGAAQSNVISSMNVSGSTITLTLKNITVESGDAVAVSYNGTYLKREQDAELGSVVKMTVKNNVPGGSTILADCETTTCILGGSWYTFNDKSSNAASVITPTKTADMLVSGGQVGSAVKISYTLNKGSYQYEPFVGFGFNLLDGDDETPYDCTGATGISFYHKGSSVSFQVKVPGTGSNYHCYTVPAHNSWSLVTISWNELEQEPYWGTVVDFSEKNIFGLQWQVKGSTGQTGDIWIDEVTLIGKTIAVSSADKSALEKTLASANSLYGAATTEMYPQSAITTFYTAIDAAATVNMNAKATQTEVDNANTTLTKAIATFKATAYADKSSLQKAIASATTVSMNAVIGSANGQYPQSAKDDLDAAIAAAQTSYNTVGLTATEVSAAVTKLNAAVTAFNNSKISTSVVDKAGLKDIIDRSTDILATTTAGTSAGQYSATSRASLESALKTANTTYSNASATQSTVDTQTKSLIAAYNAYVASKVTETAVDDVEFAMSVYPNPCSDVLNISATEEIQYVRFISVSGVKTVAEVGQTSAQIDVNRFANGLYSVQVVFADGTVKTTKFIKK